jgi:hypothetical protein
MERTVFSLDPVEALILLFLLPPLFTRYAQHAICIGYIEVFRFDTGDLTGDGICLLRFSDIKRGNDVPISTEDSRKFELIEKAS